MSFVMPRGRAPIAALFVLFLIGCAPVAAPLPPTAAPGPAPAGLPPVPRVDGTLEIRVVHPTPATPRPNVDSTFVYGSVGTGFASLTINGAPVTVAPNGAFLGYLPVPADGQYRLVAESRGQVREATAAYRAPAPPPASPAPPATPVRTVEFEAPRAAVVSGVADTLATGSGVAIGRPTPTGAYRWLLPRGARLSVTAQRGDQYRVAMGGQTAWIAANQLTLADAAPSPVGAALGPTRFVPGAEWDDVRIPAGGAPFLVEVAGRQLALTLHGVGPGGRGGTPAPTPNITAETVEAAGGDTRLRYDLARPLWGYKAWYEADGTLVLRLRHPPRIDPAQPLRGIRVLIDPGHPPAGATGPTGLTEADANLAIALPLAEQLRARGAEVVMTRTTRAPLVSATNVAVELGARVDLAVRSDAHLLVSVHNNAFGEGVNPFRRNGTSVYHFHPHSAAFARALNAAIVDVTRIADLGALQSNLALVRPTWMPSALTESLFMMIPEQEAALRDPGFLERLAAAHVRGIEDFLRQF
jgi:N-acetylmuramoyl-L-alanine amidase